MSLHDALATLGVNKVLDERAARAAFRQRARQLHPDRQTGDAAAFHELSLALERVLKALEGGCMDVDEATEGVFGEVRLGKQLSLHQSVWRGPCERCGDTLEISQADLDEGYNVVECASCSLAYDVVEADQNTSKEGS
eukprot:scaffold2850_cov235-Pinguiococcus_pyrenoidosus.AAC.4